MKLFTLLLTACFLLLGLVSVISFPRLSTEQGVPCQTCHINPGGGGARTEFGNQAVALNELCLPQTKDKFAKHYKSPRLSPSVLAGADLRYLILDDGYVFRMQTDAFLTLSPLKDVQFHFRFGEDPFGEAGIFESYALWQFDQARHYVKIGRFYPAYGLRNGDHKAYIRERTGHGSNLYLDGLSVGATLGGLSLSGEILSRESRGIYGLHLYRVGSIDRFGYLLGASLRSSERVGGSNGANPVARAIFGGLSYDRYTLLGEFDLVGKESDTLISYAQLTTRLEYGLYLIGEYNFFDGNRDLKNGTEEFFRASLEIYPMPFFQLRPSYTRYTDGARDGEDDFFVQVHFGY